MIIKGAGILFMAPGGKALFLKRGPGGDHPNEWCLPGGTTEGDETPIQTAEREAVEEVGALPPGERTFHVRTLSNLLPQGTADATSQNRVDFTTFIQRVKETFEPKINGEHTGYAWAPVDAPPEPLHPGVRIALARLTMDELGVARAIAAGELTSPQRYGNMWLFDLRITGTGVAYRGPKIDEKTGKILRPEEFVYRRPENYLNQDFLARCNGLQVIMMHPKKALLNSDEFNARTVGAVMLPYIGDGKLHAADEVWAISKIYDEETATLLQSEQMSTSPAVLLGNGDQKLKTENGTDLLIEGLPSLVDHLAICPRGVWDKAGEPSGVRADNQGEYLMTEEDKKAADAAAKAKADAAGEDKKKADAKAKADAEAEEKKKADAAKADADKGVLLDKILSGVDAMTKRMDAMCGRLDSMEGRMDATMTEEEKKKVDAKKKADAEEEDKKKADAKAKADAEAEAEAKKKADAIVAAANPELAKRIAAVEKALPRQLTDAERHGFAQEQARADDVYMSFGKKAPYPLAGEDLNAYSRRLVAGLKQYSDPWKAVDILAIADEATFNVAKKAVYGDALKASLNPTDIADDEMREIVRTDTQTGIRTVEFRGKHSFVHTMSRPPSFVTKIGRTQKEA
jgi:8-oxo-dGTP pyrophosphatase MutT (NUDIX family)